jgi:hypothetical protein
VAEAHGGWVHEAGEVRRRAEAAVRRRLGVEHWVVLHAVALQVAFERQILKPVFHLIGYRLWV